MAAPRSKAEHKSEHELRLVTFDIGPDRFAFDIMGIVQIIRYEGSTDVPKAPDFVEGIILLRDQVIPIVDLRLRLFPGLEEEERRMQVVIVRRGDHLLGLKVDRVQKIVSIAASQVLPAPPLVQGIDAQFLEGVVRIDDAVVLVIDLERVLTTEESRQLARVQDQLTPS